MISLPEVTAISAQIAQLGAEKDNGMASQLDNLSKQQAINTAKDMAEDYQDSLQDIVTDGLDEVGDTASDYYAKATGVTVPEGELNKFIKKAYSEKYYGLTLGARLTVNKVRLKNNITKTGQVLNKEDTPIHLAGVYTKSYPYGAQVNIDQRVVQATAQKLEQDIAKLYSEKANYELIRWALSGRHSRSCVCEDLANSVDRDVEEYLKENDLDEDPRGLYFRNKLPRPPHPFCQCEFELVGRGGTKASNKRGFKRSTQKIRQLVQRIRGK